MFSFPASCISRVLYVAVAYIFSVGSYFIVQALKDLKAKAQKGALGGAGLKKSGKK